MPIEFQQVFAKEYEWALSISGQIRLNGMQSGWYWVKDGKGRSMAVALTRRISEILSTILRYPNRSQVSNLQAKSVPRCIYVRPCFNIVIWHEEAAFHTYRRLGVRRSLRSLLGAGELAGSCLCQRTASIWRIDCVGLLPKGKKDVSSNQCVFCFCGFWLLYPAQLHQAHLKYSV